MQKSSHWLFFRITLLLLAIAFAVVPLLPAGWFIAHDPTGAVLYMDRGHFHWMPFNLIWGTLGWARIAFFIRVIFTLIVAGLCFWPENSERNAEPKPMQLNWRWVLGISIFSAICGGLFAFFNTNPLINQTFGDGDSLTRELRNNSNVFPAEVLTMHLFNFIWEMLMVFSGGGLYQRAVVLIAVCGSGAVFVWASAMTALLIGRDRVERFFLFAGPVCAGSTVQFFGYLETTYLVLTAFALFFAASAWMIQGQGSRQRRERLMVVYAAVSLAILAHGGGIVLLPPAFALTLCLHEDRTGVGRLRSLIDPWAIIGFILIIVAPFFFIIYKPFFLELHYYGNLRGGADKFNFVPWNYEAARAVSQFVYYGMLSWRHAIDIGMGYLVAAPLAIPMIAAMILAIKKYDPRNLLLIISAIAAISALSIPLLWEFDYGAWGDWNIVTAYLYPLNFFAWLGFILIGRHHPIPARSVLLPALLVQIAMGLGILLQLY